MTLSSLVPVLAGFGFGLSLIVAIGAQNAFVLRQGIRKEHVLPVVAVCAVSDAVLIAVGVAGLGSLLAVAPWLLDGMRLVGAGFLLAYAMFAARRALRPSVLAATSGGAAVDLWPVLATCFALTWLNPHVYLDTVVLLGSVAAARGDERWAFGLGAVLGSVLWFAALGYGARLLRPVFARASAWRFLDAVIAVFMTGIAATLLLSMSA